MAAAVRHGETDISWRVAALTLGALFAIGGPTLQGFSAAMIFGIVVGTYSSIFVAAPILMITKVNRDTSED